MIIWAITKENGCIVEAGVSKEMPEGAIELPANVLPEASGKLMRIEGEWIERPEFPVPVIGNGSFFVGGVAEGTTAFVYDKETLALMGVAEMEEGSIDIELPDAGTYLIEVFVPEPFVKPELFEVVSEAE
ncbi:hypothetical protein MR829_12625 [Paracoccus versutus]|uniref:hypothetical protein n=1 Tax=Paracoccus versutus TaxID=34007 RepID=UPI001FB62C2F|nr:hypothetical protein [Paracoccus versutus]MCJ1901218.1 hypothetical protein [Paracoccus versutus]